ncbi:MAG: DUF4886 domain-containing protein [Oscillospiraceae bacterium]|nr:DUF4886 domain-containing protein [Oscillospiraceae bacterium]
MRKRLISMILLTAILLSMIVVPTYAEAPELVQENVTSPTETCPCGCGEKLQDVEWKVWAENPSAGHYYLDSDYVQSVQITVLSDTPVVLDLRGHTITTEGNDRLFLVNGFLHVMDTVGGGRMMAKGVASGNGGVVLVEENEMVGPVFCLYSGTITPDPNALKTVAAGGLVYVGTGSTFRMTGGVLMDGYAKTAYGGGAVSSRVSDSTIEILGGTILNCYATGNGGGIYSTGVVRVENTVFMGCVAGGYGGNIHISSTTGQLTVKNSVITGGISKKALAPTATKYGGGNISVYSGAKATITDCEIYGGYAACVGGNLSLGRGTTTITNCNIYGGTAEEAGGNVYANLSTATVTFNGGSVDGHFYHGYAKLTLKGALKVSDKGLGLQIGSGTLTTSSLTSGAEIYVSGNKTLGGSASYYKAANRGNLDGLTLTTGDTGYCSQCGQTVTWAAYGTEGATHVYLTENLTDFAEVSVTDELAIDLCGFSITATGRAFSVAESGKLQIIDSVGTGAVSGSGVAGENGGLFNNAGTLTLMGGKYTYVKNADIAGGGVIYNSGALNLSDVILDASAYNNAEGNGGAICMAPTETAIMTFTGGYVLGGTAYYGGGIFCDYKTNSTLTGVHLVGGKAAMGGNLATYGTTSTASKTINLTMTGCNIADGTATHASADEFGGNLYLGRCVANITDCLITGGNSDKYGGNLVVSNGTDVTFNSCVIAGGEATNGGNLYGPGNSVNVTFTDCLITGGSAATGGNITMNNGECKIYGGEISYGTSTGSGGNIYAASDDKTGVTLSTDENGNPPLICQGTAESYGGNLCAKNIVTVNAAHLHSGEASVGKDLYVTGSSTNLVLGEGITGTVYMNAGKELLTSAVYGGLIENITCKANATFLMDTLYGDCGVVVKDNAMYVATTAVVDSKGNATWYSSNADAVAACDKNSFVKLFTNNDLVLTKDLYVDLNGKTVNVSGDYKFYGMDSSGDSYAEPTGAATGTAAATYDVVDAPNGNRYIAVVEDGNATYHRLFMKITGVSIRPSANGMYYGAKWYCDDTLKGLIDTYGVAASTADMPDSNFASNAENRYTVFYKDSFVSGETKNGAVITGIMSEGHTEKENEEAGKTPVYAKAYLTFNDGTTLISGDNIHYSLYDVMKGLDSLITEKPIQYRKYMISARNFYEAWKDNGMSSWKLNKIPTPADDGVIDVLMIGNSWCYYFLEELYALAEAAGVPMRVCNVYYSGCPVDKHYNWWVNGESHYQFFETDANGRKEKGNGVSLEWCLAQGEWDVITMNVGGGDMRTQTTEQVIAKNTGYVVALFDYFKESFPNADFYFHQSWSYELGYLKEYASGDFRIDTVEDQMAYTEKTRQVVGAYVEAAEIGRINTGDAWELYRAACNEAGIEHNLCARLGNNGNKGDGGHDGDIGGGQYLNACVWFEILTGKDCRDTTYIPTYKYDGTTYPMTETMAEMLQDAAHKAAAEMWPTYPENAN